MKKFLSGIRRRFVRNQKRANAGVLGALKRLWGQFEAGVGAFGQRIARILPYVLVGIFSAAIPPMLVYGHRYLTHAPSFAAKKIVVAGNSRLSVKDVLEAAGVDNGPNVLSLDLDSIVNQLSKHPWIESAKIQRELPDCLIITIRERNPAAMIALGARYLVDDKGEVFKRVSPTEIYPLPTITGLVREDLDSNAPSERRDLAYRLIRGSLSLLETWVRSDPAGVLPISEVHPDPLFGYTVTLRGGSGPAAGAVIHLGHGDIAPKVSKLAVVVADAQRRNRGIAVVRLDNERDPSRVAVRLRKDARATDSESRDTGENRDESKAGANEVRSGRKRL